MGYLQDFIYYGSGTECPRSYLQWAGLSLLGAVAGRKIWLMHGDYFPVLPQLYVCLVGTAGSGKSTAKNMARSILVKHFPSYPTSANFQSHQDIIDIMATAPDCLKTWKDEVGHQCIKLEITGNRGQIYEYRRFYIIANEFASLLSTDLKGMTEFLVDIYDENSFSTGFKGARKENPDRPQQFANPCVSVLACAVPRWFMGSLKMALFEGGLGRRLIIAYEQKSNNIDDPKEPPGAQAALARVVAHLKAVEGYIGPMVRTPQAMLWWKEWFHKMRAKRIDDPILAQFKETKHIQVLKLSILLALNEFPIVNQVTDEHLQIAVAMLEDLEPNIVRLTSGIGRNELAAVAIQVLEAIKTCDGMMAEKQLRKMFFRDCKLLGKEFDELLKFLQETEQIKVADAVENKVSRRIIFLPEKWQEIQDKKAEKLAATSSSPPTSPSAAPPETTASPSHISPPPASTPDVMPGTGQQTEQSEPH